MVDGYATLNRSPRNLSHDEARRVYDRIGRGQDAQRFYEDAAIGALLARADFESARFVVELGCGTGRIAKTLLRERLPGDARYVAIDQSPRMIDIATARLQPFAERARVVQSDGTMHFPVGDGQADRVLSTYVFDLLGEADITAAIAEARRVLQPGGRLCLVNLTYGRTPLERVATRIIEHVHAFRPAWIGGCRPIAMGQRLSPAHWHLEHHRVVRRFGLTSEVLVAAVVSPVVEAP